MSHFTTKRVLFLVPSKRCCEEYAKIDKFMGLLEKSEVWKIIESVKSQDENCKGPNGYNPYNLFATVVYCFAKFDGTLREIADKCVFDFRVHFIMQGKPPNFSTICLFINKYIVPYHYEIFTAIVKQIIKDFNLRIDMVFQDGTKFEANAKLKNI